MSEWNLHGLNQFILDKGEDVIIETAIACTCRNSDAIASMAVHEGNIASSRKAVCPICRDGNGTAYRNARYIRGIVSQVSPTRDRKLIDAGFMAPGDLQFSPQIGEDVTIGDKITLLYPIDISSGQVIVRGASHMDQNLYTQDLQPDEDRLWYEAVCAIWCEDENGVRYHQGTDFVLEARRIRWITPLTPGTVYTIKYTSYVEWVAYVGGSVRVENGVNLGNKFTLRQRHVAFLDDDSSTTTCAKTEVVLG